MRYVIHTAATLATLTLLAATCARADDDVERHIRQLDAQLQAAVAHHDAATVDRMLLDEFVLVTSTGALHDKREILGEITDPELVFEINESHDLRVRVQGDTAVVTGVLRQKGVQHGRSFDATVRYTDTWVRVGDDWRQMSGHASRLPTSG